MVDYYHLSKDKVAVIHNAVKPYMESIKPDAYLKKLKEGDTAIVYLPGHYGTIVDYNAKKDKYLLMDPHYLPKRGTSSFGDWVSQKDLEEGALMVQTFFYYKAE